MSEDTADASERREAVRERYGSIAEESKANGTDSGCCDESPKTGDAEALAQQMGYGDDDLGDAPEGANLGLGCGNPTAIAALSEGETVLDLGSGGGFDCFLAAREVGTEGHVIGIDMTPEMIERARENAAGMEHVEFRLGEIEHLPVSDGQIDVIISNCVINLSPDKRQVYEEAYRALASGGRLAVSDVVLTAEIPEELQGDLDAFSACVSGSAPIERHEQLLADAGFEAIEVVPEDDEIVEEWDDDHELGAFLASARIEARKP